MRINSLTDIGSKRSDNQDNFWSAVLNVNGDEAGVVCLCDGMGGLEKGELASRLVVSAVREYVLKDFEFSGIEDVLSSINNKIYRMSNGDKTKLMGTTCTVLMCYKGLYHICHIGDSRGYLLRGDSSYLLTTDHSVVKKYGISKDDNPMLWNKYKNKLTKCIGVGTDIEVDLLEGEYQDGDVFLLCSDGCWHFFDDEELTINSLSNLRTLFARCIQNGETDNLTAGILRI